MLAARAIRRENLDLVHSQARTYADDVATLGGGCHADYLARTLQKASPLRRAWEHNHPFHRITIVLEQAQYQNCSRIILNSQLAKNGLIRFFPWAEDKCRVIHNGVDADFFRPDEDARQSLRAELGVSDNAIVFLFVGSGFERKGLAEFLQALALTRQRRADVDSFGLVVGRGDIAHYRSLAQNAAIGERVFFHGPAGDTRPFYAASDVFVLPTRFDPYANTTNEALASGLPVITTTTNGACEVLTPAEGLVVPQAEAIESLAEALQVTLETDRRLAMSKAARQLALRHPWSETTRKTLEVYAEIKAFDKPSPIRQK